MALSWSSSFLIRESDAEYRRQSQTNLSSHALADFRKCPLLYWKKKEGLIADEDRPAYLVGRAAHVRILEGHDRYQEEFAFVGPINPATGKPYGALTKKVQEWADAQGKSVLTETQIDLIENMAAGLSMNDAAVDLIVEGIAEGVVRTEYSLPVAHRLAQSHPRHR